MKYVFDYGSLPMVCTVHSRTVRSSALLSASLDDNSFRSRGAEWDGSSLFMHSSMLADRSRRQQLIEAALAPSNTRIPDLPQREPQSAASRHNAYVGNTTSTDALSHPQVRRDAAEACDGSTLHTPQNTAAPQRAGVIVDGQWTMSAISSATKRAQASRFCHICLRRAEKVPMAACSRLQQHACRKVVCVRCFDTFGWDWHSATQRGSRWQCPHCCHT
eukprot:TRINITY_DN432_c0_g1_i2.p1 TRINITY_DN432_c0_g1~~TRINITY_DN432_c0_g1_i2.p1  ORF type:complete len:218 (+),score=29.50 TRINITY_DN432_c0_g1_i2:376-1029(+)